MSAKTSIDLNESAGGRGASPEGERSGLPAAGRSSSRKRSAIVSPTR
jgi:hypothetical protein